MVTGIHCNLHYSLAQTRSYSHTLSRTSRTLSTHTSSAGSEAIKGSLHTPIQIPVTHSLTSAATHRTHALAVPHIPPHARQSPKHPCTHRGTMLGTRKHAGISHHRHVARPPPPPPPPPDHHTATSTSPYGRLATCTTRLTPAARTCARLRRTRTKPGLG